MSFVDLTARPTIKLRIKNRIPKPFVASSKVTLTSVKMVGDDVAIFGVCESCGQMVLLESRDANGVYTIRHGANLLSTGDTTVLPIRVWKKLADGRNVEVNMTGFNHKA